MITRTSKLKDYVFKHNHDVSPCVYHINEEKPSFSHGIVIHELNTKAVWLSQMLTDLTIGELLTLNTLGLLAINNRSSSFRFQHFIEPVTQELDKNETINNT